MSISLVAEGELQDYLKQNNVESFLKDLVFQICLSRPINIAEFVRNYALKHMQNDDADDSEQIATWVE